MASLRTHVLVPSLIALCAPAALAAAQGAAAAPAPAPAPAPAAAAPDDELPPPPPAYGSQCAPACREGFVCHEGQCVSACNPPCAAGETCTASGACLAPATAAPSFPVPSDTSADQPPPEPIFRRGVEQHDGFMLRLTIGGGGGSAFLDPTDDPNSALSFGKMEFSGGGSSFSFDIGGSPTDNLVITFRISEFVMWSPKLEIAGGSGTFDGSFGGDFVGPALTYYFMPINLYITGAPGFGQLRFDIDGDGEDARGTDFGFGLNFDIGKEWWVGDNWGLGLAGRFLWVSGTDEDDNNVKFDFGLSSFALLFSATYQ